MSSYIRVYLFPDTIKYLKQNRQILGEIEKDTQIDINIMNKRYDPYITIEGKFESVHKTRIIFQDIEKNNYREAYLKTNSNK